MSHNPFTPPTAEVADPVTSIPPQPSSVRLALQLVIGALVLSAAAYVIPGIRVPTPEEGEISLVMTIVLLAVFGSLTLFLASRVMRGKNWARFVLLAYLGLGWLMVGMELNDNFVRSPLSTVIDIVCVAMEVAAMVLLLGGASQRWFSAIRLSRGS
ncbi:hypothetical protein [Caenimonas sp. SL110]|uniref:hypothetical protein n=1 Tax=Caenimonas sp. SL110 TaxID=1450524 RepID=UPI000652AE93|nr:hypothetical protein [Caenimonas sp. SL110]